MSGILNKKSRILDFVLTSNGRKQIENGDIRYRYATLSDKSIVYTRDHDNSYLKKSDVTDSEFYYFPLETTSSVNDEINPEFDLRKFWLERNINIPSNQNNPTEIDFDNDINNYLTEFSLGTYLNNLKFLKTKSILNPNQTITFHENSTINRDWDFNNETRRYVTLKSLNTLRRKVPVIALDKRFSHKRNFAYMPPLDISGQDLYDPDSFKNIEDLSEDNGIGFVFSSYNRDLPNAESLNRKEEILNIIQDLENISNLSTYKKIYEIEKPSEDETLIFSLYEVFRPKRDGVTLSNNIKKLQFLNLGTFYDYKTSSNKTMYLIGKVYNTRDKDEDFDLNTLFDFDEGIVNLNSENNAYTLSAYFSFVCLFTLVVDH